MSFPSQSYKKKPFGQPSVGTICQLFYELAESDDELQPEANDDGVFPSDCVLLR